MKRFFWLPIILALVLLADVGCGNKAQTGASTPPSKEDQEKMLQVQTRSADGPQGAAPAERKK